MGKIDNLLSRVGLQRKAAGSGSYAIPKFGSGFWSLFSGSEAKLTGEEAMKSYVGWVFACARAIGEEMAKARPRLFRVNKNQNREELFDHELLDLLKKPNKFMTGWQLMFLLGVNLEILGKNYWLMDGVASETDQPTALYPMLPHKVETLPGEFPELIKGFKYTVDGKIYPYTLEQILSVYYPNPNEVFGSMGVVQGIAPWIDADNNATKFNANFFKNGARIGGFLESQNYQSQEMLEYMNQSFKELITGVENAYKVIALPDGTKFTEGQQNQKDMDFAHLDERMGNKIMAGFRVPRSILGITDDVNRANAEATDYIFATRTVKPKLDLIESFFNSDLVPRYGDDLVFEFADPTPENREMTIKENQAGTGNQPYMSVNEVRESLGLPPIDGGDAVMGTFNMAPLGEPRKAIKNAKPQSKAFKGKYIKPIKKQTPTKKAAEKLASEAARAVFEAAKKTEIKFGKGMDFEPVWKAYVGRVTPYEKTIAEKIQKFNGQQLKEVLDNLPNATKAVDPQSLFDESKAVQALIDFTEPALTELYEKEGAAANEFIGAVEFTLTPELRKALHEAVSLMAESYNKTTLAKLVETLDKAISNGASLREMTDEVKKIYEFSDAYRAELVARTEAFRTANEAAQDAWKQTGVVKTVRWYTAQDELVCPACADMDGQVIELGKAWFSAGDEIGNMTVSDYGPGTAPQDLHPGCRCQVMPEDISID